jgi:hypothetical protein
MKKQNQNQISICIPRVDNNTTKEHISNVLQNSNLFKVDLINEIPLRNDPEHKRILMKIRMNRNNENAQFMEDRLKNEGNIKFVYDMPWYWKICLSH